MLVKNSTQFSLPNSRRGFAEDEEEDREHEEDRAPAAEADDPFDGRLGAIERDAQQCRNERCLARSSERIRAWRHSCSFTGT